MTTYASPFQGQPRIAIILSVLVGCMCVISCDDTVTESMDATSEITDLRVFDIGNSEDASDILMRFKYSSGATRGVLRFYLTKYSLIEDASISVKDIIDSENYMSFVPSNTAPGKFLRAFLSKDLLDTSGDPIANDILYQLSIAIDTGTELFNHGTQTTILLKDVHPQAGEYKGIWNDSSDGLIKISLDLVDSADYLLGTFYFTNIFEPCCGGLNDGTISMWVPPIGTMLVGEDYFEIIDMDTVLMPGDTVFSEGDTIVNLLYSQDLDVFNTILQCTGRFTGNGSIEDLTRLNLEYSGVDCIGNHRGTMILDR